MRSTVLLFFLLALTSRVTAQTAVPPNPEEYRHFIMPSAKALDGSYLGFWELAFLQGGVGITDEFSISGGITIMPSVSFKSQFGFLQSKLTLANEDPLSFAVGYNLLRMTSEHLYHHIFGVITYEAKNGARYSGMMMYKMAGDDFPIVRVLPYGDFGFTYGGPIGAGGGFEIPFGSEKKLRFIAEVWSHDVSVISKIAVLGAVRVAMEDFSSDFGFMYLNVPIIAPVANFVWHF